MGRALGQWVIVWRYWIVAATLLGVAVAALGARHLIYDSDYRVWFSDDNPQLQAFEAIQNTYTKYDNVLLVLGPANGDVFSRESLAAVEWLTSEAWRIPYSRRVDSLSNFQHSRADGDEWIISDLYSDASRLSHDEIARIKSIAMNEPLLLDHLVSSKGHVTAVNVTLQVPGVRTELEMPQVISYCRELKARFKERFEDIDVYLTGIAMMNQAFPEASRRDTRTLIPIMFAVVVLILALITRSLVGTVGTVLVTGFSIAAAMGLAGWFGFRLTGGSAISPIIILTLAVADCIHVMVNFIHHMRRGGTKKEAIVQSLHVNFQPIMLTSLTTAIGFLSMNFSDVPPFRDLGNIVAMGVAMAFLLSVTFLPAFLAILPLRVRKETSVGARVMEYFAEYVVSRPRQLLWVLVPLMLVVMAFIPRNEFNDEFVKYFDESIAFRRATDFTTNNLTGMYTIHMSLESGVPGGISEPEFIQAVEGLAAWFRRQPEVIHVNVYTDILKRLNKNLHGDDPDRYALPESRDLAAQYLLLYEMSLPYGLDLNDQINVDKSAVKMVVSVESLSTQQTVALDERAREWLRQNAPESMHDTRGSSPNVMFAHIAKRNVHSMLLGITVAMVLIALVLVVALRSWKLGLISMVPNLVPLGLTFGAWGILVGQVGLATSVVSAMTLGIIVDDTVHFLSKYSRARQEENMSAADSVRYAFSTVGMALWATSVILVAGFLVLAQSAFQVNAGMGVLAAISISFALLADFLLLPPLLMVFDEKETATVTEELDPHMN